MTAPRFVLSPHGNESNANGFWAWFCFPWIEFSGSGLLPAGPRDSERSAAFREGEGVATCHHLGYITTPQNLYVLAAKTPLCRSGRSCQALSCAYSLTQSKHKEYWHISFCYYTQAASMKIFFRIFLAISSICSNLHKLLGASGACLSTPLSLLRQRQPTVTWCSSPCLAWMLSKD